MIFARSLAEARLQRTHLVHPDGRETWMSPLFTASAATPDAPMAFFVEKTARAIIPPHFHEVNQFQVVVEGHGTLGKHEVHPWTVHYTNAFTGYGPLCAAAAGLGFLTLRNRFDAGGARYFPAGRSFMKPAPKRHRLAGPLALSSAAVRQSLQHEVCDVVLALEADGLAAWLLRLGPDMRTHTPDPAQGGGQYLLVAGGTLLHNGAMLPSLSCVYVSTDTGPLALQSGADGLEALILQFPVAEASPPPSRKTSQPRQRSSGDAVPDDTRTPEASGDPQPPPMANPEHVALVRQGAAAIAAWREAHPGERLDLQQADLAGVDLRGANLQGARLHEAHLHAADLTGANLQQAGLRAANLVGANLAGARLQHAHLVRANLEKAQLPWARLQRAHLHGAYLHEANLQDANLQRALLVSADLVRADLRGAYLERADLQWANLQQASLAGAHLQEANLHESVVGHTTFGHTHLHGARGLDTCRHQASSALDVGTLACSGILPADFLRGCGWPEALIGGLAGRLQERPVPACIERALALPTSYQQVGLHLLTYVGTILRQRHPDIPARWRIEHVGPIVRLLVDTPPEQREMVEQTLQAYGSVVAEHQTPEAWLTDPAQAWHLQQHLEVAATALRLTHDPCLQSEIPSLPPPLTVTERLRHIRQLVGNALHDL